MSLRDKFHWSARTPVMLRFLEFRRRMGQIIPPFQVLSRTNPDLIKAYEDLRTAKDRYMVMMTEECVREAQADKPETSAA